MKIFNIFNWGCRGKNNISKPKPTAKYPAVSRNSNLNPVDRKIKSECNAKSLHDRSLFNDKLLFDHNNDETNCLPKIKNHLEERKKPLDIPSNRVSCTNPFKKLESTEKSHEVTPDSDPSEISESNSSKGSEEDHGDQLTNKNS